MKRASSTSVGTRGSRNQPFEAAEERHYEAYAPHQPVAPMPHAYNSSHLPHAHPAGPQHTQAYPSPPYPHPTAHNQQPQGAQPSHAAPPNNSTANPAYVTNLQQQIYFLELELQLLKQTNPTLGGGSADPDAPLDSLVSSLREKYIQQTAQHDTTLAAAQDRLEASTQQLQLSEKEKERLALELDALKERTKEWKETARQKRADAMLWEKRATDGEAEATERHAVLAQRIEKLEVQVRQQCVERAMCEDKWQEGSKEGEVALAALKDEVAQLRALHHTLQQREVELQHQLDAQPHHALREELERIKAQQREREKHWREMQLRLEERDEQVAVLERQRDALSEEGYELRRKLEAEEAERRRRENEEALHAGGRQKWSEELVKSRHSHAAVADEVAACKDRIERLKARLREEKEEKLGLLHTVREWEQRIAQQQAEHEQRAHTAQQQRQQLDQLSVDFQVLRDEHAATQQRLSTVEADKSTAERALDEREVELARLRKQSELLRLMEGVNVHEMTAAASSHQRMADVIGRLVGQMASREADEDRREAGRWRVQEMNAGGLESARSEAVVQQPAVGRGRDRDEEKMREEAGSEDGSALDSPRSVSSSSSSSSCASSSASSYSSYSSSSARSSLPSRPSTGSSLSRPSSVVSAVSGVSVRGQQVRRGKDGGGKSRSSANVDASRQRTAVRATHSRRNGSDALLYS